MTAEEFRQVKRDIKKDFPVGSKLNLPMRIVDPDRREKGRIVCCEVLQHSKHFMTVKYGKEKIRAGVDYHSIGLALLYLDPISSALL